MKPPTRDCASLGCRLEAVARGLCKHHHKLLFARAGRAMNPGRRGRPPKDRSLMATRPKTRKPKPSPRDPDQPSPDMDWINLSRLEDTVPGDRWWDDAACAAADVAMYPGGQAGTPAAKTVCRNKVTGRMCPVLYDCLAYAMAEKEHFGVWGGCSERERRRLVKVMVRWRREHPQRAAS